MIDKEAFEEAIKRYPEAENGLIWFINASGLNAGEIKQRHLDWAASVINK